MKLHISHIDLDGCSCAALTSLLDGNIQHAYLNYDNIDDVVSNLPFNDIEWFLLSDLMVTDKSLIQKLKDPFIFNIPKEDKLIVDHHLSAKDNIAELSSNFTVSFSTEKSATLLLYEMYADFLPSQAKYFSQIVNDWDMFERVIPESEDFAWLATVCFSLQDKKSHTTLTNNLVYWLQNGEFTTSTKGLINEVRDRYAYDLEACKKTIIDLEFEGKLFRFATASRSVSRLSDDIGGANTVVVMYDTYGHIHFRTKDKDIDVSKMAELFGGGGHKAAAGAGMTDFQRIIFKMYERYIS